MNLIKNDWNDILNDILTSNEFEKYWSKVEELYRYEMVLPPKNDIFNALNLTAYNQTRVVILGQDPYHGEGEAHGLAFSVLPNVKIPPSLRNIYKEIQAEFNVDLSEKNGDLTNWAKQGVLLLNSTLTVKKDTPNSHKNLGWSEFTDEIIKKLNENEKPVIFMLWGNFAIKKEEFITNSHHLVLKSPHPSPFSARKGFFGNNHFLLANEFLEKNMHKKIDWCI